VGRVEEYAGFNDRYGRGKSQTATTAFSLMQAAKSKNRMTGPGQWPVPILMKWSPESGRSILGPATAIEQADRKFLRPETLQNGH
jgi:hypothetical protein